MVKLIFCVRRRPDISEEEFHRYWREEHGPLVPNHARCSAFGRCRGAYLVGTGDPGAGRVRGTPEPFDGVAELWFDSVDSLMSSVASIDGVAAGEDLLVDERRFIDHARSPIFLAEEHAVLCQVPSSAGPSPEP